MSLKFLLTIKQAEIGIQSHQSCCAWELPMWCGCIVATSWWISTTVFHTPRVKNAIKVKFLRTYFAVILIVNGSCTQAGQVQKRNSRHRLCNHINKTSNEQRFPRTDTYCQAHAQADETWSDKLWTCPLSWLCEPLPCTEPGDYENLLHWIIPEGYEEFHPVALGWFDYPVQRVAILNQNVSLRSVHQHGNIWQFTAECLVAFSARVSLSYNLFSFYWIETQFPEFLNSLANIIKLPWLLGNNFKKS